MKQTNRKKPKRKKLWKKTLVCGMVLVAVLPIFSGLVPRQSVTQVDPKLAQAYLEAMSSDDEKYDIPEIPNEDLVEVIDVPDNTSLTVLYEGVEETARLIGVESQQAAETEHLKMLLADDFVKLEFDTEQRDEDGNLLVYAFLENGSFLNEELLRNGWAKLKEETVNTRYEELLYEAQEDAKTQRSGIWE